MCLTEWECPYQWFSSGVQLVFGSSQQQSFHQDVEPLSASVGAVVHLCFPQFVLIEWRTAQKPEREDMGRVLCTLWMLFQNIFGFWLQGQQPECRSSHLPLPCSQMRYFIPCVSWACLKALYWLKMPFKLQ